MENASVVPIVGESKAGAVQFAETGAAAIYQGQGDAYGSIQPVTEAVPPVILTDQVAQQQDFINGGPEIFTHPEGQQGYSESGQVQSVPDNVINIASTTPQIIADFNPAPVNEPVNVPEHYTPLEGDGQVVDNKQIDAAGGATIIVTAETIKSGEEVTKVSIVPSVGASKEKSMSPPVLEEEKEIVGEMGDVAEEAPVIEAEETVKRKGSGKGTEVVEAEEEEVSPAKSTRGKRGRQSSGKSDESAERIMPRRGRAAKGSKSVEDVEDEDKKQYPKRGRSSPAVAKESKKEEAEVEEIEGEEEEEEEEEVAVIPPKKGRGRAKKAVDDSKATPTPKGKGRGKGRKSAGEEVTPTPRRGRGRQKKVAIEIEEDDEEEEVEEVEEEEVEEISPSKRRGRPTKSATLTPKRGRGRKVEIIQDVDEVEEVEEEMEEEESPTLSRKRGSNSVDATPAKKQRVQIVEETEIKEEEDEIEEIEEIEEQMEEVEDDDDEEYENAVIRRGHEEEDDPYSFEEVEDVPQPSTSQEVSSVEIKPLTESPAPTMKTFSTQTPIETPELDNFVEVVTFSDTPGKRTVMTQTDPRLKKKRFGPLGSDGDEYELDDTPRKRKFKDDGLGLFEDTENRRRSFKRNAEEALKCPFCDKAFIGLVKHIKTKHKDEPDFEEEMRNAKWRERIMKVSTMGENEDGEPCPECGKMSKNLKRHMELHQQNRMQIP